MSKLSQEELDKLFQQGAEQYDFEYNAAAWTEMEIMLNKDRHRRFIWWWLGGFIVLGLISFFYFNTAKNTSSSVTVISSINKEEQVKEEQLEPNNSSSSFNHASVGKIKKSTPDQTPPSLKTQVNERAQHQSPEQDNNNRQQEKIRSAEAKNTINTKEIPPNANRNTYDKQTAPTLGTTPILNKVAVTQPYLTIPDTAVNLQIRIQNNTITTKTPLLPLGFVISNTLSSTLPELSSALFFKEKERNNSPLKTSELLMGLSIAREVSSVGIDDFSAFNWKVGGQLAYRYRQKYSASIGLHYIKKKYNTKAGEYIPPRGFWTRMIAPNATSGQCNILEIPILVSYYPHAYSNNGFYGQVGLTSYFMLKERYVYSYDLPDPDLIREWGTKNENQHWLGLGQISVGYQYITNKKTIFQFTPYIQIPLTGVGHGQVKLWSIGMNVKINFKLSS